MNHAHPRWRIGVDIGGTFTDVVLVDEVRGGISVVKVPTTPRDFARGVLDALTAATRSRGVAPGDVTWLAHATTVVTNALLEGKGARTALVTTRGMKDVLELRRSARASLYDLFQDAPAVLVPRHLRLEVTERVDAQGEVVEALRLEELDDAVDFIKRHDVQAVAVCLLYSFLNDTHERLIGARLRAALPELPIFLSSEVLPEIREFERTSTTCVCAYVGPILASYLARLEAAVTGMGLPAPYVMGSSGGVFTVAEGLRMPAMAVESGPAAGVIAAALVGRRLGLDNVLSFDMGGTTAKASLIEHGRINTTSEYEVGGSGNARRWLHGTGHPIRVPVIDLAEVSAGGGSIAWIDPGGALRVGPESAGAEPGPVSYGQGGTRPTVTDADLVLGYLNPVALLGGALPVHLDRARGVIEAEIARPLGLGVLEAAGGIVDVVNAGMAAALRIVSVERGYDPREFALVAFGGAGPVHAARLAQELEIPVVIVPPIPGGFSAPRPGGERRAPRLREDLLREPRLREPGGDGAGLWRDGGRGAGNADAGRRPGGALGNHASRRLPLRAPGLRAQHIVSRRRPSVRSRGPRSRLPRQAPDDVRPREPRRAGSDRESPGRRGGQARRPRPVAARRRQAEQRRDAPIARGVLQGDGARAHPGPPPRRADRRCLGHRAGHHRVDRHDHRRPARLAVARRRRRLHHPGGSA